METLYARDAGSCIISQKNAKTALDHFNKLSSPDVSKERITHAYSSSILKTTNHEDVRKELKDLKDNMLKEIKELKNRIHKLEVENEDIKK